ncbi:MAG: PKD domain-containing protein, partial [Bacteroidales bacterium]|nr:PKD domain-containing protein [Bacteroidales bacterium]
MTFVSVAFFVSAQVEEPTFIVQELDTLVNETSGIIFINGKLWTHNDSGGEAKIYCIDTVSGQVVDTKVVAGVVNEDWEDMAKDRTHLYIGNFGAMSRNLQILRIKIEDLDNPDLDTLVPRIINFTYGNPDYPEPDFSATSTRFDCEAMIAKDDTIFLFSKNWIDHKTYLYAIPNKANFEHTVVPVDTLELDYLVCGADYDYVSNTVALVGYTYSTIDSKPHITLLTGFEGNKFLSGEHTNQEFTQPSSLTNQSGGITYNQVEGIAFRDSGRLWVTNERVEKSVSFFTLRIPPHLREFKISSPLSVNDPATEPTYPEEPDPIEIIIDTEEDSRIILEGDTISFLDLSTQTPTSWQWAFEGGTPESSSEQNPQVVYNNAGSYSVTLTAENSTSRTSQTFNGYITVYAPAHADFTFDHDTIGENHSVNFTSTSTGATSLLWTFEGGNPETSTEENPQVTYTSEGVYSVSLTASNPVSSDTYTVTNAIVVNDVAENKSNSANIYPNPVSETIFLSFNEPYT